MKRKITMYSSQTASIQERFQQFLSAASANGFSERTLKMYRQHLHSISKHLDIAAPLSQLTKTDLEAMVESMRTAGLAHNSISSYLRVFKSFLSWCKDEGYANVSAPSFRQKETVKDTYTDEELKRLLEKPKPDCSFCEYRNWVMIQFLLNSGCRASTIRNIQNRDVDLDSKQVIFRHTKTSKIQVIPLCSTLSMRLKEYMRVRAGEKSDYLFCTEHGEMMSEDALRNATDMAGGYTLSLLRTITDAIQASKLRWVYTERNGEPFAKKRFMTIANAFYLATKGGAFFGKVGSFEPGYEFDAVVLDDAPLADFVERPLPDRLQRILWCHTPETVTAKFIQGKQVYQA